ncbi:MAG: MerR family transcriptional regulator [Alteraurantiacibacter sp.]
MSGMTSEMSRFDDGKAPDAMRTIGEVSAAFGIKPHVLRYWEQQFPMLQPLKRSGGRRLYRAADIALVDSIDRLVNQQGYTLKGAKKALLEGNSGQVLSDGDIEAIEAPSDVTASEILVRLHSVRNSLASAIGE